MYTINIWAGGGGGGYVVNACNNTYEQYHLNDEVRSEIFFSIYTKKHFINSCSMYIFLYAMIMLFGFDNFLPHVYQVVPGAQSAR